MKKRPVKFYPGFCPLCQARIEACVCVQLALFATEQAPDTTDEHGQKPPPIIDTPHAHHSER